MIRILNILIVSFLFSIACFGQIEYLDQVIEGQDGLYGLEGTTGITYTNNKEDVYVTSQYALSHFRYNNQTNILSFQRSYLDNTDGMDGFYGASCVTTSKDDKFVYVASSSENCITILNRDTLSGVLSLNTILYNSNNGIEGLGGVYSIIISDDNKFLYSVAWSEKKISVFQRDTLNGSLTHLQSIGEFDPGGLISPRSIKLSNDNNFLYVSSGTDSSISVFERDDTNGTLTHVQTAINNLGGVQGIWSVDAIDVSYDGRNLYAISNNNLTVFSRNALTGEITFIETHEDNQNGVDGLMGSYSMTMSTDDRFVYCVSFQDSSLVTFSRNLVSGSLSFIEEIHVIDYWPAIGSYSSTAMISDNDHLLFTNYWGLSVCSFIRDSTTGMASYDSTYRNGENTDIDGLNNPNCITISPDNNFLYVSTNHDGISTYSRNDTTGLLIHYQTLKDNENGIFGLEGASSIYAGPGNKFVFVTGKTDDALTILERETNDSLVHFNTVYDTTSGVSGLKSPTCFVLSEDSKNIYIGTSQDNGIAVFNFDTLTGNVGFVQHVDLYYLNGLQLQINEIDITKSGTYFFALSTGTLYMFQRNVSTGELFLLHEINLFSTDTKMDLSEDDNNLYLTNPYDNTILNYHINSQNSTLNLVQIIDTNSISIFDLESVKCIKVAPDDRAVYTTSTENSILTMYNRDSITGLLDFVKTFSEDIDLFQGLDAPSSIAIDSYNRHLYITSSPEDAVSTYKKNIYLGEDLFLCTYDSVNIYAGQYYNSYLWNTGDTTYNFQVSSSGMYSVIVTDHTGNIEYDTISATVYTLPQIDLGNDVFICDSIGININIDSQYIQNVDYSWNTGNINSPLYTDTTGVFIVEITDTNMCSNSDTIEVFGSARPSFYIYGEEEICLGDTTEFWCSKVFPSYLWNNSATYSNYFTNIEGVHYLEITDTNNCVYLDSVTVTVVNCTGIDDVISNTGYFIYPNPSSGIFTIERAKHSEQDTRLIILDINSKVILETTLLKNQLRNEVDISQLSNGLYYVLLKTAETFEINKLIKH